MKSLPPEYTLAFINLLLILVMGVIAWLIKRAVSANDTVLNSAIFKIDNMAQVVGDLKVIIAGDLYPRKEHMEYARHIDEQLNMIRKSVHDTRDQMQPLVNRLAVIETLLKKEIK